MIYVGTSGYSYDDWVGLYYPEDLDKKEFLSYYAGEFPCTELNFTYYRMPNPWMIGRIADKVPKGFLFTVKLNKQMTHEREDLAGLFKEFTESLRPLLEQDKFDRGHGCRGREGICICQQPLPRPGSRYGKQTPDTVGGSRR